MDYVLEIDQRLFNRWQTTSISQIFSTTNDKLTRPWTNNNASSYIVVSNLCIFTLEWRMCGQSDVIHNDRIHAMIKLTHVTLHTKSSLYKTNNELFLSLLIKLGISNKMHVH